MLNLSKKKNEIKLITIFYMKRMPTAIAISKTKFNFDSASHVNISSYDLFHSYSFTSAGKVGYLYRHWFIN